MSISLTRQTTTNVSWNNSSGASVAKVIGDIIIGGDITPLQDIQLESVNWIIADGSNYRDIQIYLYDTTNGFIVGSGIITKNSKKVQLHDSLYWVTSFSALPLYKDKTYRIAAVVNDGTSIANPAVPLALPTELQSLVVIGNGYSQTPTKAGGLYVMPTTSIGSNWKGDFSLEFKIPATETTDIPWEPLVEASAGMFNIQLPEEWLPKSWTEWELQYQTSLDNTVFDEWKSLATIQYPDTLYTYSELDVTDKPFYRFRYRLRTAGNRTEWSEAAIAGLAVDLMENLVGQVSGDQIQDNAIGTSKIQVDSITSTLIAANSINTSHLQAGSVVASKIAAGTITANEIAAGTITATQIAANTITAAKIAAGTITATEIKANTITAAEIAVGTITATEIKAATINNTLIQDGVIEGVKLKNGTITATQIAADSITSTEIKANTITASDIAAATITTNEIAASTIKGSNIAANTITATNILAGTITSTEIGSATITGSNIAGATITASNMTITTLSALTADLGTVTAGQLRIGTAGGTKVAIGQAISTSGGSKDGIVGTDSSNNITFYVDAATGNLQLKGQILSGSSGLGNITGTIDGKTNIVSGTITGDRLVANTITASQIAAATITGTEIAASTIATTNLAANAVTTAKLNATAIDGMTITGATVQTSASGSRVVLDSTGLRTFNASTETLRLASSDGSSSIVMPDGLSTSGIPTFVNPSADVNTLGWTGLFGGTFTRTTSSLEYDTSPGAFKLQQTGLSLASILAQCNSGTTFFAGETYVFTIRVKIGVMASGTVTITCGVPGVTSSTNSVVVLSGLTTSYQTYYIPWSPPLDVPSDASSRLEVKLTGAKNDYIFVDSLQIYKYSVPTARQLAFKNSVTGDKLGGLYGFKTGSIDSSTVILESTPLTGNQSVPSSVEMTLKPVNTGTQVALKGYRDSTKSSAKNSAEVWIRDDSVDELSKITIIDSAGGSSFMQVREHGSIDYGLVGFLPDDSGVAVGDRCIYDTTGIYGTEYWYLYYDGDPGGGGAYPWKFIGGSPLTAESATTRTLTNQLTYANLPTDPLSVVVPQAGIYDVEQGGGISAPGAGALGRLSYSIGATAANDNWCLLNSIGNGSISMFSKHRITASGSDAIAEKGLTGGNFTVTFTRRSLWVTPVRIG